MINKIYNFSAGPAILPAEVLEKAQAELLSLNNSGMSVMEISHRSETFEKINQDAQNGIRDLLGLPHNYKVLFLQGGATFQFLMIPMNFLSAEINADYIVNGAWGKKAVAEAKRFGRAETIFSSAENGFKSIPVQSELKFNRNAVYVHYTSNETIEGVEFKYDLNAGEIPVVCDASSNILSKPIDVSKYALIYAGAQKNLGPSGVTVVIIRDDLLEKSPQNLPAMLSYQAFADHNSMINTPNTWGIYLIGLVCNWIKTKGGLAAMQIANEKKAQILYDTLDQTEFYRGHAEKSARSMMNVTFRLPSEELEKKFCAEAAEIGLDGLKGHRSVGGVRASIYNAFPLAGVERLIEFMREFECRNG